MLDSSFLSVTGGVALLCFAASVCAPIFSSSSTFLLFPFPCPRSCLVPWSRDVGSAVPPRVAPPILRPERIRCLLTGSAPPSRFPRWYASFGAMTVGSNYLACGFNWQCTADVIGYAVMIKARLDSLPSPPYSSDGFSKHTALLPLGREQSAPVPATNL